MKKELALSILPLVLFIGLSSGQETKPCPPDNFHNINVTFEDAKRTSNFGLDLFKKVNVQVPKRNLFFSPYSVWSALAIAYFGAEGKTLSQLQGALRLEGKDKGFKTQRLLSFELSKNVGVQLDEANRAYFDNSLVLEKCFQRNVFHDVRQIDFSNPVGVAHEINSFVNKTTKGLIPEVVTPDTVARASFVLVNAIYFKGFWEQKFDKKLTKPEDFFCQPGIVCGTVNMMTRGLSRVLYFNSEALRSEVVEIPYKDSSVSMFLILPWEETNTVDGVVNQLDLATFSEIVDKIHRRNLVLKVPKFKLEVTLISEMLAAVTDLGVTDLFQNADLSAFTKSQNLSADTIIHKAVVDVTEEGTEAAAVTAILPVRVGSFGPPPEVVFNRPFAFVIADKNLGLMLFMGTFRVPPV
ncbi:iris-like [Oratosquilla oratoria]|uniref:iris-like n=1 Tax=Oratosquilla oratoria TaxID=337810 RepID=UPI003F75EE54